MGGAEQFLKMVANFYEDATVRVFYLQYPNKKLWNEPKEHIQLNYPKSKNSLLNILRFVFNPDHRKNKPYDYIFTSHVYTTGLLGVMLRWKLIQTVNFIARESTSIFLRYKGIKLLSYKFFYWISYKKVDLLICQTQLMKNQLLQGYEKLEKITKLRVIPNPIDLSLIKDQASLSINETLPNNYIVSAGRLIPEKGYDILITSFCELKIRFPEIKLMILGDGYLKKELLNLVETLGLKDEVVFKGFVSNVYPFFKNASVCVVSSRMEGFPNVLLQMMSQNSRVVSTTCAGGISEIPGIYISETNNVNSLTKAIQSALESHDNNRTLFDEFLNKRDISSFMARVRYHLDNQ